MEMMEMSHWQKVAVLVQAEFQEGRLAEEATRQAVVLIPEGGGDYHGIDLVEVVRKVVTLIINRCFTTSISFHNFLHGFRTGCVTGTASLEAKMIQQLKATREEVILTIYLDLHKEYGDLDRDRFLNILEG